MGWLPSGGNACADAYAAGLRNAQAEAVLRSESTLFFAVVPSTDVRRRIVQERERRLKDPLHPNEVGHTSRPDLCIAPL